MNSQRHYLSSLQTDARLACSNSALCYLKTQTLLVKDCVSGVQTLLSEALAAEWTPKQAAVLSSLSGVESVHDAVTRTSAAQVCSAMNAR